MRGRDPFPIVWVKAPFFNIISPLCVDMSEIEAEADVEETVALYVRVSTEDQSLDRQCQLTHDYATDRLGIAMSSI
jgi:predicted site-specific integrase-resolvase